MTICQVPGGCAWCRASGTHKLAVLVLAKGLWVLPQVRTPCRSGSALHWGL